MELCLGKQAFFKNPVFSIILIRLDKIVELVDLNPAVGPGS